MCGMLTDEQEKKIDALCQESIGTLVHHGIFLVNLRDLKELISDIADDAFERGKEFGAGCVDYSCIG